MKKIFTSILIMAGSILTAPATSAQNLTPVNTNFTGSYSYISTQYTQSNNSYLVLIDSKYDNGYTDFKIYDENLNEIKSITIQDIICDDNYKEVYLRELEYNPDAPKDEWSCFNSPKYEDLVQRIYYYLGGEDNTSIIESNGQTLYYPTDGSRSSYFFEYNTYGSMYPSKYYYIKRVVIDGDLVDEYELMEVDQSDCWVKTDRWSEPQIKDASHHPSYDGYCSIYPYNCNTGSDDNDMEFTQTLFNNDSDFEYIAPIYKLGQSSVYERDYTKEISYDYFMIGFAICNTSGNELQRILFPQEGVASDPDFRLVTIGNKEYIAVRYSDRNDGGYKTIFYTIGANGTGLQQATEPISVRVAPTLISHDQSINVELDDIKGDGQLSVTDIAGRTVFSSKIQENGIYQIPARSLSRGMNIVTVQTQSGNKSTKVIVK